MKKLLRLLGYFGYHFFAKHLPESNSPGGALFCWLRYQCVRHMIKECGKHVDINQGAHFGMGRELRIGDYSGIGKNCTVLGPVTLGNNVGMSFNCFVSGYNRDFQLSDVPMHRQKAQVYEEVVFEDNVVLFAHVIVLSGLRVQTGSVIAAGAVVTKSVPRNAVVAGNPARIVRFRGPTGPDAFDKHMTPVASDKVRESAVIE